MLMPLFIMLAGLPAVLRLGAVPAAAGRDPAARAATRPGSTKREGSWTIREFLDMGGYAAYVWPAIALTAAVLVYNAWAARRFRARELAARPPAHRPATPGTNDDTASQTHVDRCADPRRRRVAVAFALQAFQENLLYFYSPSEVDAGEAPAVAHVPRRRHGREGQRQARSRAASKCASR